MEKRSQLVELIKNNRLGDAINALEKATEGTPMHNQMILLAATHAEYVQLNRSATQDFQTLETQRARITQSLLSMLDELPPEALSKLPESAPTAPRATAPTPAPASRSYQAPPPQAAGGGIPKWVKYAGAGLLLLILILMLIPSEDTTSGSGIPDSQSSTSLPENTTQAPGSGDGQSGDEQSGDEQTSAPAQTPEQNAATAVNGMTVSWVKVHGAQNNHSGSFERHNGNRWRETSFSDGGQAEFTELNRDEWSVYLRDESRGVNIQLDLYRKMVVYSDDEGRKGDLYAITDAR